MNRCMLHQKAYCAICTTRPNIPEAPRSPTHPDAGELLRELMHVPGVRKAAEQWAHVSSPGQITLARIDAFLAKASHG